MNWLTETRLTGHWVTLEPLRVEHVQPLKRAVQDGELWNLWFAAVPAPEEMDAYVALAIADAVKGNPVFAVKDKATNEVVGTTRFYNAEPSNRRVMLGYTWYARSVQGTRINTECKFLMLDYAFQDHSAIAVEFRTHIENKRSRHAIEKLGAKLDGILRNHLILKNGAIRDTASYSIIAGEWPAARQRLLSRLSA